MSEMNRRGFLATLGALPVFFRLQAEATEPLCGFRLQPEGKIRVGYAAITWGGKDEQAIDEISEVGFKAIQLRATAFDTWGTRPAELRTLLQKRGLTFAV